MKKKFQDAFHGLMLGFADKSVRIQWILGLLAVGAGLIMKLESMEWAAVIICMGFVIVTEMINTCIERTCDMHTRQYDEQVRYIKDLAAGAVLVSAITALVTALIILYRHIGG